MLVSEVLRYEDHIIDVALDLGCYVRKCSDVHWKVSGVAGVLDFYPTTGTIYNAATNKSIRGDKSATLTTVKAALAKCAHMTQGSPR
ncbi:hypothetical protein [Vibrio phage JSF9]|uniref:Uncharacterized protein n=2 Tax=Enhodamvirus TaxID=1922329 RepID=A0A2D0Z709_9CAUD|nr:hypothetical protein [Vibrio phage JSF9]